MVGNFSGVNPTLCNKYANEDKEFVFCVKGRPFGCLVSPYLPTPTATIIDMNLVREIGLKMTDLQYTKLGGVYICCTPLYRAGEKSAWRESLAAIV